MTCNILGVFKGITATVWRVDTFEVQVAAALTRLAAITFDLASLAFIAGGVLLVSCSLRHEVGHAYHAIDI